MRYIKLINLIENFIIWSVWFNILIVKMEIVVLGAVDTCAVWIEADACGK